MEEKLKEYEEELKKLERYEKELREKDDDEFMAEMIGTIGAIKLMWNKIADDTVTAMDTLKAFDKVLYTMRKYRVQLLDAARRSGYVQET